MSDVDNFLSRFNHSTAYKDGDTKLIIGNYVTIQDGTYNAIWEIAGFDMEHNQYAADGIMYDNGYGICLIPQTSVTAGKWNNKTSDTTAGGYKSSYMHTILLPNIVTKLQTILGSHMVNRNVLLSSSVNVNINQSNGYTWTTAYATLMSIGQMTGTFGSNSNNYDDGEANYKLPIFDFAEYWKGTNFWSRGVSGSGSFYAWLITGTGPTYSSIGGMMGVRPLIYIR